MWQKNDVIFSNPLIWRGAKIYNPPDNMLKEAGYEWIEPELPTPHKERTKRYSTLKIIRALDSEWSVYRTKLEEAGVLDQFFAANYLSADDPVFLAFLETVPEDLQARLEECLWTNN